MAGSLVAQLKKGSTAALLLGLLREREMYGYEIAAELRERGGDSLSLSEGSLYPPSIGLRRADWSKRAGRPRDPTGRGATTA
jgi:PadR family transcriptional regulator PadR